VVQNSIGYVALDTSKLRKAVAIAAEGRDGEVRYLGEIDNTPAATSELVRKLARQHTTVTFCYEAGPTRFRAVSADHRAGPRMHRGGALTARSGRAIG
jgi:hypothetical protein